MQRMTSRTYPSTMSLRCFEAAARYLSFTKAARVLHMTQSAISKQVAHLEDSLNIQLFERSLQRLQLTPTEYCLLNCARTFIMRADTLICAHPTLCARWLIPILKDFSEINPKIQLQFQEQISSSDIDVSQIDVAFLYGDGIWRDMTSIKLFEEACIAVSSPNLVSMPLNKIEDFQNYTLIQSSARPRVWDEFFQAQDFSHEKSYIGPRFDTFSACANSAIVCSGIALIPKFFVKKELESGELIQIWPYEMQTNRSYYMIYPTSMSQTPKVATMVQWIKNRLVSD
ncbi:hypothetical protein FQR65_LT20238 [Abscondita terminalis]|nr:hypothetical protein FQR65_LT20238 [Abscondita terminalis]